MFLFQKQHACFWELFFLNSFDFYNRRTSWHLKILAKNRVEKTQNCWGDCWFELFLLINAQDNLPPFPEIFFVQILRIIVWSFRTAELDVPNTDRNTEFFFERTQMRWAALQPTVLLWSFYALVDILSATQECRLLRPIFGVVCRFAGGFPHCLLPLSPPPAPSPLIVFFFILGLAFARLNLSTTK